MSLPINGLINTKETPSFRITWLQWHHQAFNSKKYNRYLIKLTMINICTTQSSKCRIKIQQQSKIDNLLWHSMTFHGIVISSYNRANKAKRMNQTAKTKEIKYKWKLIDLYTIICHLYHHKSHYITGKSLHITGKSHSEQSKIHFTITNHTNHCAKEDIFGVPYILQ